MHPIIRNIVIFLVAAALVVVPLGTTALADISDTEKEITSGKMAADLVLVRPLGIVATLLGGGIFILSLPFSALGGNVDEAYHRLLVDPAKFTFKRPLGDL
jgi:hypothetical protein